MFIEYQRIPKTTTFIIQELMRLGLQISETPVFVYIHNYVCVCVWKEL
jgi:hypothetical protein